jgi:hypothetical protein
MILFLKDWKDYPTAIVDLNTKNESFIRYAALLKSMGVKNYYFHLALLNPSLQGVEPHSPTLTKDQKAAIQLECKFNFWYFIREVVRLPKSGGGIGKVYKANRGNISMFWSLLNSVDFACLMPRQTGKSIGADVFKIWLLEYYYKNTEIFLLTKDVKLREKNIKSIKDILNELPSYLDFTTKDDADNTEVITCKFNNNLMTAKVGQANEILALKMGRGHSFPWTQTDETAFIAKGNLAIPAMLAAGTEKRNEARELGLIYGNLFTTTAGKLDTEEGKFAYSIFNDGMYWNEKLYDCTDNIELKETVRKGCNGVGININGTFNHRQLGYSDEWLRTAIREARQNEDDANRDFFNKWTSGTVSNPLPILLLEAISQSEQEPQYIQVTSERYSIRWHIPEEQIEYQMKTHHHVITVDSGNMIGRDANALTILDIRDLRPIAVVRVSEDIIHKYSIWLANFMVRYPKTTLIIENKSTGQTIIDTVAATLIKHGINPFSRIYNQIVDEYVTRVTDYDVVNSRSGFKEETYLTYKKFFGFMTTGDRRAFLYNTVLKEAAASTGHILKDSYLINEILALEQKSGRVDHPTGGHDDMVISWLLGHWFLKYSKNLSFYGIETRDCLSLVNNEGATLTPEKLEERRKIAVLNMEINELKDNLLSAPNLIETKKYEKLLEWKVHEVNKLGDVTYSIDSILEDVRNNRVQKKSLREAVRDFQRRKSMFNY